MVTEKKKIGRPKKVKPPVDKVSPKEFGEAVHEKLLKDTADNWLTNEAIKYRADFLEERNRYLQEEVAKADNIATELSLVRNQLKILHSRSEKILHLMNKPVEPTKTEAICDDANTDGSRRDEDGYNVDTNKKEMTNEDYLAWYSNLSDTTKRVITSYSGRLMPSVAEIEYFYKQSHDIDPLYAAQITANMFSSSEDTRYRKIHEPSDDTLITKGWFRRAMGSLGSRVDRESDRLDIVIIWNWVLFIVIFIALIILFIKTF